MVLKSAAMCVVGGAGRKDKQQMVVVTDQIAWLFN